MPLLLRYRTALVVVSAVVALYALLGFFGVPYAAKAYGVPALSKRLQHPVLLGDLGFNPFTFSLTVSNFEIQQPDERPMLGFGELFVNFEVTSLVRSSYLFDEIRLTFPYSFVHVPAKGKLNLLGLVSSTDPAEPGSEPEGPATDERRGKSRLPPVDIRLLSITQGVIEYRDDSKRKRVMVDVVPIEITLENFSTRPGDENAYAFTAEFGKGETLAWEGTIQLDPLVSAGKLSLSNVQLNTFWPSIRDQFRFEILSGAIMVDARYRFDTANVELSDGKLVLSDFRLAAARGSEPLITMPSLELDGIRLDLSKQEVEVGGVRTAGAEVRAWLTEDGSVNYATLFSTRTDADETADSQASPTEPWSVDVRKVEVSKTRVAFEDRSVTTPANLAIDDVQLTLSDIHVPFKGQIPVALSLRLNTEGTVEADGRVQLDPLQADLKLSLQQIGLIPFQPYLPPTLRVDVKSGELDLTGEVQYRSRHELEPLLRYRGNIGVGNLRLTETNGRKPILAWTGLELKNLALDLAPTKVQIGEIALKDPSISVEMAENGTTNLERIVSAPEPDRTAGPAASSGAKVRQGGETPTIPVVIDVVTLSKLSAAFVDESIEPAVSLGIQDLSGTIKGLSSKQLTKAQVALSGTVDEVASMKIQGQINPLSENAYTNLKATFQGVDLTAVSPYAGKYAGYPITQGKLSLDLKYQLSKQKLAGENKVLIDHFSFGESTGSEHATGLPVRLAVALLQDRNGRIAIDMPVRGNLNEPDFKYGRVVLNALVNLISKVATSPFAALGNLVGGGGENLQFIEFQAGSDIPEATAQQKITSIATALQKRPALRVEVAGAADPKRDRDALALQKMKAEVQRRFTKGGTEAADIAIPPQREFEFLSDLYAEKLGKQPTKSVETANGTTVDRVLTADELREQLVPAIAVAESELRSLAQERAKAIRAQLLAAGRLTEERVYLVESELISSEGEKVRAHLNLTGS